MRIKLKRAYKNPEDSDGQRILVDRLWPRGLSKEKARIDYWAKELAPANELRRWYAHDPDKWPEFKNRYFAELREKPVELRQLLRQLEKGQTTFVFSAKELRYNNAIALREFLQTTDLASLPALS